MSQTKASKNKTPKIYTVLKAPKKSRKESFVRPNAGYPEKTTRISMVTGLMESPSNKKWAYFDYQGPYWNFLTSYLRRKNIFKGREDRVEEAVMNTIEKIVKFMGQKKCKLELIGKGYFHAFVRLVAYRTAIDLDREISRQEQLKVRSSKKKTSKEDLEQSDKEDLETEFNKMSEKIRKRITKHERKINKLSGLADKIPHSTEEKNHDSLVNVNFEDEDIKIPKNYQTADFFEYVNSCKKADLKWIQKMQIHILYIALGHILSNEKISSVQREMLRLRYGMDMRPQEIWKEHFSDMPQSTFDVTMMRAKNVLKKEAKTWLDLVAPDEDDFTDEKVLRLWRDLSRETKHTKYANDLKDKAIKVAGRID